jgi:hypothetical protein
MTTKILLGKIDNETVYLTKHTWDCSWYWGFGYIGNTNSHYHIDSLIKDETDVNRIFSSTWLTRAAWWALRDLFIQAYGLKKAAEIYQHGGHQTTHLGLTDIIKNKEKAAIINADLEILLEKTWDFILTERAK